MSVEFTKQLIALADRRRCIAQGTTLFYQGDRVNSIFVIAQGMIELARHQHNGTAIVLQRAGCHTVLAEASLYSMRYHCDGIATEPTTVYETSKPGFLNQLRQDNELSTLWAAHLAKEVQAARTRSEILSLKTVAERLDGWLTWHDNELPAKGQWKSIAAQIGISPEAFYRELAKRRAD